MWRTCRCAVLLFDGGRPRPMVELEEVRGTERELRELRKRWDEL